MRQEGAGLRNGQAGASLLGARATVRSAGSSSRDEGEKAGFPSPQLKALLATARRLCLKSHQLVIVPGVTLEMSMASWQGFKESSACFWWSANILCLLDLKIKRVFPEQRI